MGLKLNMTIDSAKHVDTGIWRATLEPDDAATLGECDSRSGPFSILLIESEVDFNPASQALTFDPNRVALLNIGSTDQVIILSTDDAVALKIDEADTSSAPDPAELPDERLHTQQDEDQNEDENSAFELSQTLATGDKLFLSELTVEVRELGEKLLSEIRSLFPGELNYEPRSAKFDETPEIFWTIKILPKEKALRITVRGAPDDFDQISGIDLQIDKFGYSAFLITRISQIPDAVSVLKQAHLNMD